MWLMMTNAGNLTQIWFHHWNMYQLPSNLGANRIVLHVFLGLSLKISFPLFAENTNLSLGDAISFQSLFLQTLGLQTMPRHYFPEDL